MPLYLEYEGIKGNVTADGFADHISLLSCNFGVGRGITMSPGNLSNREATTPTLSEVTVTKYCDNSVTNVFKEATTGSAGKKVTVKFVRTGADSVSEYMSYELENALVSGYQMSADADGEPMETISISYSKILVNYKDTDATMGGGSPQRAGYDLVAAKPI